MKEDPDSQTKLFCAMVVDVLLAMLVYPWVDY